MGSPLQDMATRMACLCALALLSAVVPARGQQDGDDESWEETAGESDSSELRDAPSLPAQPEQRWSSRESESQESDGEPSGLIDATPNQAYPVGGQVGMTLEPALPTQQPRPQRQNLPVPGRAAPKSRREPSAGAVGQLKAREPEIQAVGQALTQQTVLGKALSVAQEINSSGGYRFDGRNDCYGFVRRSWDPVLAGRKQPPLPVEDLGSPQWVPIKNWSELRAGDVLATHQGHKWGASWHGGLYAGVSGGSHMIFDNSSVQGGARVRAHPAGLFRFYYLPTHRLLAGPGAER